MTEARAAAALFGGVALLERAVGYALGQLQAVTEAALPGPTPCQRWDLRALLGHMDDSLAAMQEALELGSVDPEPAEGGPGGAAESLVAGLRAQGCRLLGALAGGDDDVVLIGGLPMPVRIVTSAGAVDVAVHGWDVGRACGTGVAMPEQLAEDMLGIVPLLVSDADRPGRFGPALAVPAGASAGDRLVGFLGRDPRWHGRHHPAGGW
ncbi:MAG TPA: TIGR03086 family metal-binding protein [Streptosporangiaceae bacterium]|jgi:uncharacterized protein (TIGR03086 family)|nr:TIGR03086 family metal-binding protein [Streptosporangiaceae bacterium]